MQTPEDVVGLAPSSLPNALRVILRPPAEASFDSWSATSGFEAGAPGEIIRPSTIVTPPSSPLWARAFIDSMYSAIWPLEAAAIASLRICAARSAFA